MGNRFIKLPVFDIEVNLMEKGGGTITSSMCSSEDSQASRDALDSIESLILAHACAGVDIESPAYLEGIEVAVEAIWNRAVPW